MASKKKLDELQDMVDKIQLWVDDQWQNKITKSATGETEDDDEDGDGIDRPKDPPKNP